MEKTFAEAVKGGKVDLNSIKIHDFDLPPRQVQVKDSFPAVVFSDLELLQSEKHLEHTLIAKFSKGKPQIDFIRNFIKNNWNLSTPPVISIIDVRHVMIRLMTADDFNLVWAQTSHDMGGYLYRLFKWSSNFSLQTDSSVTAIWVRFPLLPLNYCYNSFLQAITLPLGKFIKADLPTLTHARPSFARVCVEVDLLNKIENHVWIGKSLDNGFWQKVEYEFLPKYCTSCSLQGHDNNTCQRNFHSKSFVQKLSYNKFKVYSSSLAEQNSFKNCSSQHVSFAAPLAAKPTHLTHNDLVSNNKQDIPVSSKSAGQFNHIDSSLYSNMPSNSFLPQTSSTQNTTFYKKNGGVWRKKVHKDITVPASSSIIVAKNPALNTTMHTDHSLDNSLALVVYNKNKTGYVCHDIFASSLFPTQNFSLRDEPLELQNSFNTLLVLDSKD